MSSRDMTTALLNPGCILMVEQKKQQITLIKKNVYGFHMSIYFFPLNLIQALVWSRKQTEVKPELVFSESFGSHRLDPGF